MSKKDNLQGQLLSMAHPKRFFYQIGVRLFGHHSSSLVNIQKDIYIFFHLNELSITTSDIDEWWHCSCPLNPVFTMHACEFKLQMNYISWRESEICCCLRPTSPCVSHSFHRGFTEPQCWPADQFMNLFHSVDCLEEWKWLFFKIFFYLKIY